jgi:hypothetical protein
MTATTAQPAHSIQLDSDSPIRHAPADAGWILCGLGNPTNIHTGALTTDPVNCWGCRTITAGDNPHNPAAPAHPDTTTHRGDNA